MLPYISFNVNQAWIKLSNIMKVGKKFKYLTLRAFKPVIVVYRIVLVIKNTE